MLGAIIGDIAGSRFEWRNRKTKDFELLSHVKGCRPTDDSVMSLAVAHAVMDCTGDYRDLRLRAVERMQEYGRKYPRAGYGGRFYQWIYDSDPRPYNSWGNGAAMRVSACGFAAGSIEEAKMLVLKIIEEARKNQAKIKPLCSYADRMMTGKEEFKDVIC